MWWGRAERSLGSPVPDCADATFSNTQCFPKAGITRRARGRVAFPDVVGDTQRLEVIAEISEDLTTMFINSVLVAGTCPELAFHSGRLVRQ